MYFHDFLPQKPQKHIKTPTKHQNPVQMVQNSVKKVIENQFFGLLEAKKWSKSISDDCFEKSFFSNFSGEKIDFS